MKNTNKILFNEILQLNNLDKVRIRFNLMFGGNWNPIELFKNADAGALLSGHYWNYKKSKSYMELKKLTFEYIKHDFKYSILDIFKSTVDDQIILARESWWKSVLQTRKFGYNNN